MNNYKIVTFMYGILASNSLNTVSYSAFTAEEFQYHTFITSNCQKVVDQFQNRM